MPIIKLDATDSTNLYLKQMALSQKLDDFTVVVAETQFEGRGQMGSVWQSEKGKNLTMSVLRVLDDFEAHRQFDLNICVSLAIYDTLKELTVPNLHIKWPNDILSGKHKVCGILIENILSGKHIAKSIIGIGLNVNQISFHNLSRASSLKNILGRDLVLDEVMHTVLRQLKRYFEKSDFELKEAYEEKLFRKGIPSTFKANGDELFMGIIRGVSPEGKLMVGLEDESVKEFGLKEVVLQY